LGETGPRYIYYKELTNCFLSQLLSPLFFVI